MKTNKEVTVKCTRRFLVSALLTASLVAGPAAVLAPAQTAHSATAAVITTTVKVTLVEWKIVVTPKIVRRGNVVFMVTNRGKLRHDFKIAGKKTPLLAPGKSAKFSVRFPKAGSYRFICTVPGHAAAGQKGVLKVS